MTSIALAFAAGLLTILSPCVLPLLPIVLGAAVTQHRWGPLALASGLTVSFTLLGMLIAVAGFALGLSGSLFRMGGAIIMMAMGLVLLVPAWQTRLAIAGGSASDWSDRTFGGFSGTGLNGQFGVGLLLGAVWSPCVGPTLGAASLLASQGRDLAHVTSMMVVFGLGAVLPLIILGFLSRSILLKMRGQMLSAGQSGKALLGLGLLLIGTGIVTGADKWIETVLVNASPAWLIELTTRF